MPREGEVAAEREQPRAECGSDFGPQRRRGRRGPGFRSGRGLAGACHASQMLPSPSQGSPRVHQALLRTSCRCNTRRRSSATSGVTEVGAGLKPGARAEPGAVLLLIDDLVAGREQFRSVVVLPGFGILDLDLDHAEAAKLALGTVEVPTSMAVPPHGNPTGDHPMQPTRTESRRPRPGSRWSTLTLLRTSPSMRSILAYLSLITSACAGASEPSASFTPYRSRIAPGENATTIPNKCAPDADGDRVADATDRCPKSHENFNGFQDNDGCADELPDWVYAALHDYKYSADEAESLENQGSATEALARKLRGVARVMNVYPEVGVMIFVFGVPADEIRYGRMPLKIRADSLKAILQNHGEIDPGRIEAIGVDPNNERVIGFSLAVKVVCGE